MCWAATEFLKTRLWCSAWYSVSCSWWFSYPSIGDCQPGTEHRELPVISAEITVKFRQEKVSIMQLVLVQQHSMQCTQQKKKKRGNHTNYSAFLFEHMVNENRLGWDTEKRYRYTEIWFIIIIAVGMMNSGNYSTYKDYRTMTVKLQCV